MNDFEKMEIAKKGDRQAWSYLYVKYQNKILEVAKNIISDEIDIQAEDLMQKYWLFTIESSEKISYHGNGNFEDWLISDFENWYKIYETMKCKNMVEKNREKCIYL